MFWRSHRNLLRRSLNFLQVPRLVIDHILVSGSHVGRLTVYYTTVLGKIYKKKINWIFLWIVYSLNLIVSRKSSEGGSINASPEPLSSSAVLSNRLEPSCRWVQVPALYYQSLSDPLRLLEVMYSDASPSPSPRCVRPQQHVLGMRMLESSGQSRLWHRQLQAFVRGHLS